MEARHFMLVGQSPPICCKFNQFISSSAAFGGYIEVVRYLVEHGADINAVNDHKINPIAAAEYNDHYRIARYLQEQLSKQQPAATPSSSASSSVEAPNKSEL